MARATLPAEMLPGAEQASIVVCSGPPCDQHAPCEVVPDVWTVWRPTQDLTLFGSYKKGFLSGGFNSGATNFVDSIAFDQQTIRGFEGGIKTALLDGKLRTNLSLYSYKTKGLQVSVGVFQPSGITVQAIRNAGGATTKGAEFDVSYSPVRNLTLRGAVAYNRGRYTENFALCYRGQTQAMGCNQRFDINGVATSQDLAGEPMLRSPEWSGNAGVNYEMPLGNGLKLGLSADMTFSSSFYTEGSNNPRGIQRSYKLFDASARLASDDDRWEVALIGRNLGNKYYYVRTFDNPFTGTPAGNVTGILGDTVANVGRGQEVMLRLTYRMGD